jgi:hypothetical protein
MKAACSTRVPKVGFRFINGFRSEFVLVPQFTLHAATHKRCWLAAILLLLVISVGCGPETNPAKFNLQQVEDVVRRTGGMTDVDLVPKDSGNGFTGTANDAQGQAFAINVDQDLENQRLDWQGEGDRGDMVTGESVL